jgi:hypothetical protein
MRELLLLMAIAVNVSVTALHSTPADASFSAAGQAAWDASHTMTVSADVTGYASVAETGNYANLTGTPTIITLQDVYPVGAVYVSKNSVSPAIIFGFGTWAPIQGQFIAGAKTADAEFGVGVSGGATGVTYTPSGTNAVVQFTPSGSNDVSLFREAAAGTNAPSVVSVSVSVNWPTTGVPTFAGVTASASVSVDWPTSKPIFTGATGTAHQHELPIVHTSNTSLLFLPTGTFGVGASRVPDVRVTATGLTASANLLADVTNSGVVMLSQTAGATVASTGTVSWPASVPQAFVTGLIPAGIISWPATAPSATRVTGTAAGQIFTGVTGSVSGQVFTGITGTVSGQLFSGISKTLGILPPYRTYFMWERTA